jgi:hypothetical protein
MGNNKHVSDYDVTGFILHPSSLILVDKVRVAGDLD